MPRFVLLRHEMSPDGEKPSHWDLMLEFDRALATWNLFELPRAWAGGGPESQAAEAVLAERVADHRLDYLEYEGPLSGGRGSVSRCDRGEYEMLEQTPETWRVRFSGDRLRGSVELRRNSASAWTLVSAACQGGEPAKR